jgi:hypothetical protein
MALQCNFVPVSVNQILCLVTIRKSEFQWLTFKINNQNFKHYEKNLLGPHDYCMLGYDVCAANSPCYIGFQIKN